MAQQSELDPEAFAAGLRQQTEQPEELDLETFASGLREDAEPQSYPGALAGAYRGLGHAIGGGALEGLSTFPGLAAKTIDYMGGTMPTNQGGARPLPGYAQGQDYSQGQQIGAQLLGPPERALKQAGEELYPPEEQAQQGMIGTVAKTMGGMLAAAPAVAAGPGAAAWAFAAQNGMPAYYDVLAKTGDEEKAGKALLFNAATGQLEFLGGGEKAAGEVLKKLTTGELGRATRNLILDFAITQGKEVGTELAQQAFQDLAYEHLTGEDIDNLHSLVATLPVAFLASAPIGIVDAALQQSKATEAAPTTGQPQSEAAPQTTPAAGIGTEQAPPSTEATAPVPSPASVQPSETASVASVAPVEEAAGPEVVPGAVATTSAEPQAAAEETVPEEPAEATGIKNATVASELEEMGLPPAAEQESTTHQEIYQRAAGEFQQDQLIGKRLVDELESAPRAPSAREDALLAFEANRLVNEREAAQDAFIKDPSEANQKRIDEAVERYGKTADVLKRAGRESSLSLSTRKMMLARDYSLAQMERSIQVAKGGKKLTAEEQTQVSELHKRLTAAEKAHAEYVTGAEARRAQLEAELALQKEGKKLRLLERKGRRETSIAKSKAKIEEIINRLGSGHKAAAGLDPAVVADVARLAFEHINIGVQSFAQFADDTVARLGEGIRPYLQVGWDAAQAEHDKRRLKTYKSRKKTDIQRLAERTKRKEFKLLKRGTPVEQDQEAIRLKAEYEKTRREFEREKIRHEKANRTRIEKAKAIAMEVLDVPHDVYSSFDFSAVRRQGGFFTNAHPVESAAHMARMFKAFANKQAALEIEVEIQNRFEKLGGHKKTGVELTGLEDELSPHEEVIRSQIIGKIPGIAGSRRAFVTYLNLQRIARLEQMIQGLRAPEDIKAIGEFINIATGRPAGKGKGLARILGATRLFWAPGYAISRFQLLFKGAQLALPGKMSLTVRKKLAKEFLQYAMGQAAYYAILGTFASAVAKKEKEKFNIETDPRSSDFGKIRIGDTRADPLSGLSQVAVFMSRMASGKIKQGEDVKDLGEADSEYDPSYFSTAERFVRSKLAPVPSYVWDALQGKTFTGEKLKAKSLVGRVAEDVAKHPPVPLALSDIVTSAKKLGIPATTIFGMFSLLGDGLQTYTQKKGDREPKR